MSADLDDPQTVDPLITETADRLFGELSTHEAIQAAEDTGAAAELWSAFAATGFPWISLPVEAGGSGGSLQDALEVLRLVGYHAAPVAAAETGMLGGWLLSGAGLALPDGVVTVASSSDLDVTETATGLVLTGSLTRVPSANVAERLALLVEVDGRSMVASVPLSDCTTTPMTNLAGERRDTVTIDGVEAESAPAAAGVDAEALRFRGALSRAALMAGAIEKISQLTVSYTTERIQFGRPVARFQAVQQHLVWAAQDAALVRMAAESAGRAAGRGSAHFEIASAKLIANQASARATKACHQAHGAMGMTQEYPLHHYSRRLWSWRKEYGGEREWSRWLGQRVIAEGADGLYPLVTGGSQTAAAPSA